MERGEVGDHPAGPRPCLGWVASGEWEEELDREERLGEGTGEEVGEPLLGMGGLGGLGVGGGVGWNVGR